MWEALLNSSQNFVPVYTRTSSTCMSLFSIHVLTGECKIFVKVIDEDGVSFSISCISVISSEVKHLHVSSEVLNYCVISLRL